MQTDKIKLSKEIIIETTLALIDESEGIKDVTLRNIAKRQGCAHTNLYNYFSSLDEIFWESLAQALLKMMDNTITGLNDETDYEKKLKLILVGIIDFSMDHPGWYRLIWLESISGTPSSEVAQILHRPTNILRETILKASDSKLSKEKVTMIGEIIHGYLHGELCKWINNRSFTRSREDTKVKILTNVKYLYKKLSIE